VGSVVSLREKLRWFDNQPLFGKKIVVTRTRAQASKLTLKLSAMGAAVIEFPTIEIKPTEDRSSLEDALSRINEYSWLFFTSQNAVNILFETLFGLGLDARALGNVKIAVIGPATGDELKKYGIHQDLTPKEYVAESLLDAVKDIDLSGKKVLLPCAEEARPTLAEGLQKLGAQVDRIHTYQTVTPEHIDPALVEKIQQADMVTFTSSSTARNFFALQSKTAAVCASIGPVTSKTIRACAHEPAIEASEYTIDGLVQTIVDHYKKA
jgi:uroporphyrinogen III methyltransferase/synthase